MAGLFKIDNPLLEEEDLLGIHKKQGMFDDAFAGMGRAPVNELFAGKHSAAVDDDAFDEAVRSAESIRQSHLNYGKGERRRVAQLHSLGRKREVERDRNDEARKHITDSTGLFLYPGHFKESERKPIYMTEFSDENARFRNDDWVEMIRANTKNDRGSILADVLEHDELYKHYPEAQMIPIGIGENMEEGHRGSYYRPAEGRALGAIIMNPNSTPEEQRETLLHELQHFIQAAEGWEGGGGASPELGMDYADELLKNYSHGPAAEDLSNKVKRIQREATGILPIEKDYEVGRELAGPAYTHLTGEQLARDATAREEHGIQTKNYYVGPMDTRQHGEAGQWNPYDATFKPMQAMPQIRQGLQKSGLLGPWMLKNGEMKIKEGFSGEDPYIEQYINLLKKK